MKSITQLGLDTTENRFDLLQVRCDRDGVITELSTEGLAQALKAFKQERLEFAIGNNVGLTEPPKEILKAVGNALDPLKAHTGRRPLEGVGGAHEGMGFVHTPLTAEAQQFVLQGLQQFGCFLLEVAVALRVQIIKHGREPRASSP